MKISYEYDEHKRRKTLAERGLDFADAAAVFAGLTATRLDDREDYGEDRYQTYGLLRGRLVMMVWTPRRKGRRVRIISMRNCHDDEEARVRPDLK